MFIEEILLYLAESAWTLVLHLSAKSNFPAPLPAEEEAQLVQAMLATAKPLARATSTVFPR